MSGNASGSRSPETIRASLGRIGAALCLKLCNGSVLFADVVFLHRDGLVTLWPWGCTRPIDIRVADIALVTAADVSDHKTFAAIRSRQALELEGKRR